MNRPRIAFAPPLWIAIAVLLLASVLGVAATAERIASRPVPPIANCLIGQELALLKEAALGAPSPQALLIQSDELNYLRAADKLVRGQTVTDYLGDLVAAARTAEPDPVLYRASPTYRLAYGLAQGSAADKPSFVSYRSVVFPAVGVPILKWTGCTAEGLTALRYAMLPFRALLIVAAGLLAWLVVPRFKLLALTLASLAVATDAQLNEAGSFFMPDMPGAALMLLVLCGMVALHGKRSWPFHVGLGLLIALAVLVKSDLLYVLPLALLVSTLGAQPGQRLAHLRPALLVLGVYALVMAGYMLRNHHHTQAWFVTSKDSINLYIANTPDARLRDYRFGTSAAEWATLERIPVAASATLKTQGPELALRQFCREQFLQLVAADPLRILSTFGDRLLIFLKGAGVLHYPLLHGGSPVLSFAVMGLALMVSPLLVLAGLRRRSAAALLSASFAASLAIVSLVCVETRYLSHLFALATVIAVVVLVYVVTGAWAGLAAGPRPGAAGRTT